MAFLIQIGDALRGSANMKMETLLSGLNIRNRETTTNERVLAFMAVECFRDLCEAASTIVEKIRMKNPNAEEVELAATISIAMSLIGALIPQNMSHGEQVRRAAVVAFPEKTSKITVTIFEDMTKRVMTPRIQIAVKNEDERYFIDNFETIFPEKGGISLKPIKVFLTSDLVSKDDKETLWEYIHELFYLCSNQNDVIKKVQWV